MTNFEFSKGSIDLIEKKANEIADSFISLANKQKGVKITTTDFNFQITRGNIIYVDIDFLRFVQEEEQPFIVVYDNSNGEYEYLDEIDEVHAYNISELEIEAKKWILDHVEITREV